MSIAYDVPPPGSPPSPSAHARPNDYGNSNGNFPADPLHPSQPAPSFIRRAVGALLPQHYTSVPTSDSSRLIGGGTDNDGVFANVMAKPQPQRIVTAENGELYLAPENSQRDPLPSYADAQADAAPSYWETVVHAPADPSGSGILVDDLPTGSILVFVLNAIISFFFQFVGFFLTYLLHTTHAAKYGSRAGLGLTLIQYGLFSRSALPEKNNSPPIDMNNSTLPEPPMAPVPDDHLTFSSKDWLSILFMSIGWFLLLSSIIGYWRVKRWEASIRSSQNQALPSTRPSAVPPAEVERERIMRQQIENVFGITIPHPFDDRNSRVRFDESGDMLIIPNRDILAEARLRRDLHAAGLL